MSKSRQAQFELERLWREKILSSSRENRATIVDQAYREIFEKFPNHSRLARTDEVARCAGRMKARLISPLLRRESTVLEIGCGTGYVVQALNEQGFDCTGAEISQDMLGICKKRGLKVIRGSAHQIDCPDASFDAVFSQEVLEHLHPEDVPLHFQEAHRLLRPNGLLIVETPNCRTGPQDISRGYTRVPQGLHLKEWSVRELIQLFQDAGFTGIRGSLAPQYLARRSMTVHRMSRVPATVKNIQDRILLSIIPTLRLRTIVGKLLGLDDIYLFAEKSDVNL